MYHRHQDAPVRTTVTLEPDVASKIKELAHRRRASFKATLNDVLRRGLAQQENRAGPRPRFVVEPHAGGFRPGIDIDKLNQLVDELEVEDFAAEARSGK
jgi:hypothetical protein